MSDATPADLTAVLAELTATRNAMADTVARMRQRNLITAVLSVVSILFLIGYLGYAYFRYGREVTPELVAANAQVAFEGQLPAARVNLEQNLKDRAPKVIADAFEQLKTMPDKYAATLQANAMSKMDAAMPEVQDQMYKAMKAAVDQTTTASAAVGQAGTPDDEARLKATLKAVGDVYAKDTLRFVDQTHQTYASDALAFTDYMDRLATSPNLDRRDQLHREMFRTVFALVRERAATAGAGGSPLDMSNLQGKP